MPEIRSVSVRLDADVASYIAKMKLAGKATDEAFNSGIRHVGELNTSLGETEKSLGKVDAAARKFDTSMSKVGRTADQTGRSYDRTSRSQDKLSGGMRILLNTALALGPALVPIGAVGIPALAGFTGAIGDAALGVGVTELAFHGLGKALDAFNKASLAPTTANIQAAQTALDALPPSAQALVVELHKLSPVLDHLRQSAASGIAPGVTTGLQSLVGDAPVVNRAVHSIAVELGGLAAEAGRSLSGPEWKGFIRTVGVQAPQALDQLGHATGSVVHGLASLYLAFGPTLGSFDQGVNRVAKDFDRWASSLGQSSGFQSFLAYIALNGPRVTALLGDTASLLGDIVKAAAPLGGPTLQALDLIVKVLDEIAKSPLGTPLILLAQINAVLHLTNNLLGVMGAESRVGFGGITRGAAQTEGVLAGLRAEAVSTGAAIKTMFRYSALDQALGANPNALAERSTARSQLLSTGLKGGLAAGGVALLTTGAAGKIGLSNTATLALAGSLGGPLVAGAGAAVGAIIDVSKANDGLVSATHSAQQAINSLDFAGGTSKLQALDDQIASFNQRANVQPHTGLHPIKGIGIDLARINDFFTHSHSEAVSTQRNLQTNLDSQKTAVALVQQGLQGGPLKAFPSDQKLQGTLTRIQPALQALGVTTDQLVASANKGGPAFDHLVGSITHYLNQADSAKGQTKAVADAFASMSDDSLTAAQRVQALTSSLDAMVDPMLTLGGATDTFQQDLNDLGKNLSHNSKSLVGNSDAVIQNRGVIRGAIGDLKAKIEAEANAGASSKRLSGTLRDGVGALIAQGRAAGLNTGQIKAMIAQMHLTPKLIRTLIEANANPALAQIQAVQRALAGIDRVVNVHVNVTRNTNALLADVNTPNPKKKAGGGSISGPGGPTSDQVPIWASNGEFMMRAAAVNQYGVGMMHAINAGRYARGGLVDTTHVTSDPSGLYAVGSGLGAAVGDATRALHGLRNEAAALSKQEAAERAQRQKIAQQRATLVSSVRDGFRPGLFGQTADGSSIWSANGGLTDPLSILNQSIRGARQYRHGIATLRRRGLRGGALAQVQTTAQLQQALGLSRHEDRQITDRYGVEQRASRAAANEAGTFRYGRQLDSIRGEIQETNRRLHGVEAAVKHHEHEAKKHSDTVAGSISDTAGRVRRKAAGS